MITFAKLYMIVAFAWNANVFDTSHIRPQILMAGLTDQAACERIAADLQRQYFSQRIYCVEVSE
jgi:hypothetical protein